MSEWNFDLFGHPISSLSRPVGRPRHQPTENDRAVVDRLHKSGKSHVAIASALGITAPTLRLNYFQELQSSSEAWKRRSPEQGKSNNA